VRVTVLLSTYRQPEWLRKTLWGYARQSYRDFELLVADDGSGAATRGVIEEAWSKYPHLELRHAWHEDRGYRRYLLFNRAVLAADGEYIIFSDADCIPREDFVATHARLAAPGRFLSGGAVKLPLDVSEAVTEDDVATGRAFRSDWLAGRGFDPRRHRLRLLRGTAGPTMLDVVSPTGATWNGNNASTWRDVVIRANGFEQGAGYGGQDREFGERLWNLGLRGLRVRHRAVLLHLDHGRPYKTEESMRHNRELRQATREGGVVRARCGIDELEPDPDAFVAAGPTTKGAA
jgi:glycosyltransferase involved in cell wall biosynthesis